MPYHIFRLGLNIILFLSIWLGICMSCNSDTERASSSAMVYALPEEYFMLDSSAVGIQTIADNLNVPWEITWGPDGWIWYTEIGGKVSKINPSTGETRIVLELQDVFTRTTPGLMGMAVHPDQKNFPYLYVLYTQKKEEKKVVLNVSRFTLENDQGIGEKLLLEVPGGLGHNGSRIKIGKDGKVYIATGEAAKGEKAQDVRELGGKILRINFDGSIPADNPFTGSPVWAWGLRNPQGLVVTEKGRIYVSDHGQATDDELNLIEKRGNYGWPDVEGYCDTKPEEIYCRDSVIMEPLIAWTPTIAPAGIDYYPSVSIPEWENAILLATLKGSSLRILHLDSEGTFVHSEKVLLDWKYGRLRDVCISPTGDVYISTSNRDWRASGIPEENDDRIIRLFNVNEMDIPDSVPEYKHKKEVHDYENTEKLSGEVLYASYCASCHQQDGEGIKPFFPPLAQTQTVLGDEKKLVDIVLNGLSGPIEVKGVKYDEIMPSFYFLSDEEIAKVLNYVRTNFGNTGAEIMPDAVKRSRSQ